MTTVIYGINNCDSVKKAKRWLGENQIDFSLKYSNTKTVFHENIFLHLNNAFDKIVYDEQMLYFYEPIEKILKPTL